MESYMAQNTEFQKLEEEGKGRWKNSIKEGSGQ